MPVPTDVTSFSRIGCKFKDCTVKCYACCCSGAGILNDVTVYGQTDRHAQT